MSSKSEPSSVLHPGVEATARRVVAAAVGTRAVVAVITVRVITGAGRAVLLKAAGVEADAALARGTAVTTTAAGSTGVVSVKESMISRCGGRGEGSG